ncbi:Smr/MutS family protein [Silvimonas iriomotensis]|nr:Smr/MutS family protein [Silvimonas iriomotensis]
MHPSPVFPTMSSDPKQRLKEIRKTLKQQAADAPRPIPVKPPEPTDHELFVAATKGTVPLYRPVQVEHPRPRPSPWPRQREKDEAAVMAEAMSDLWPWDELESGEELLFIRPGLKLETLRKLRRGEWVVQAQLDLHGHTSDTARLAVAEFLLQCRRTNKRCVRIIHGKGLGSKNREPVLKLKLKNWLAQRDEVLGFSQARPVDGGAGAVLVLLKGWREK